MLTQPCAHLIASLVGAAFHVDRALPLERPIEHVELLLASCVHADGFIKRAAAFVQQPHQLPPARLRSGTASILRLVRVATAAHKVFQHEHIALPGRLPKHCLIAGTGGLGNLAQQLQRTHLSPCDGRQAELRAC
ncbi:hypothetical protein JKP88DRAFT_245849 [Tribonema minus]|uniref:Uncharacterized protein n=1 Tax=Tribonema minus TaxID=303371 RepID=A0A835Z454_9STRA|nr:hypothetical protein JKP88DRAFT_245849 [Tribonema minus]